MSSDQPAANTQWWSRLEPATRTWLMNNNGDAVPDGVAAEVLRAGGPAALPAEVPAEEDGGQGGLYYSDEVIDWIEATANAEDA
ncbi:hypothetical protein H9638_07015 [Arthrobacter sp. Sa2BUA2]|uniref:Uncharacterized protein n=1 Tax=Arthrobacter pullicola TaxID=2762224 RepID=A0ABR8YH72_9MICC|nr:hypothetical protein [Arthrobacter pullicola]MBD8043560.1 hypothetical protein [Arthrobacter pullicola]